MPTTHTTLVKDTVLAMMQEYYIKENKALEAHLDDQAFAIQRERWASEHCIQHLQNDIETVQELDLQIIRLRNRTISRLEQTMEQLVNMMRIDNTLDCPVFSQTDLDDLLSEHDDVMTDLEAEDQTLFRRALTQTLHRDEMQLQMDISAELETESTDNESMEELTI